MAADLKAIYRATSAENGKDGAALQNVATKWRTVQGWREALREFTIRWPERIEQVRAAQSKNLPMKVNRVYKSVDTNRFRGPDGPSNA